MTDSVSIRLFGANELRAALARTSMQMAESSLSASAAACEAVRQEVVKNLQTPPRWNHRGSGGGESEFDGSGARHSPRSGPTGTLSGDLLRSVRVVETGRRAGDVLSMAVGAGDDGANGYKVKWERRYPFFAPAVNSAETKLAQIFVEAYTKTLTRI